LEYAFHRFDLALKGVTLDAESTNVLALELHQWRQSTDFGFDLSLTLETSDCSTSADLNGDSWVDHTDLAMLATHYSGRTAMSAVGDFDCDGVVGLTDVVRLRNQMDALTAPSPAATPAKTVEGQRTLVSSRTRIVTHVRAPDVAPTSMSHEREHVIRARRERFHPVAAERHKNT
jgi:hypothetical protein